MTNKLLIIGLLTVFMGLNVIPQSHAVPNKHSKHNNTSKQTQMKLRLPEKVGFIHESYRGSTAFAVVYIGNISQLSQTSEATHKLIRYLIKREGISAVILEDEEGNVSLESLPKLKDKAAREQVLNLFLEQLNLSGTERNYLHKKLDLEVLKGKEPAVLIQGKLSQNSVTNFLEKKKISYFVVSPNRSLPDQKFTRTSIGQVVSGFVTGVSHELTMLRSFMDGVYRLNKISSLLFQLF